MCVVHACLLYVPCVVCYVLLSVSRTARRHAACAHKYVMLRSWASAWQRHRGHVPCDGAMAPAAERPVLGASARFMHRL